MLSYSFTFEMWKKLCIHLNKNQFGICTRPDAVTGLTQTATERALMRYFNFFADHFECFVDKKWQVQGEVVMSKALITDPDHKDKHLLPILPWGASEGMESYYILWRTGSLIKSNQQ